MYLLLILSVSLISALLAELLWRHVTWFCQAAFFTVRLQENHFLLDSLIAYGIARLQEDSLLREKLQAKLKQEFAAKPWASHISCTLQGLIIYSLLENNVFVLEVKLLDEAHPIASRTVKLMYEPDKKVFTVIY
jgi:hypothetical protein